MHDMFPLENRWADGRGWLPYLRHVPPLFSMVEEHTFPRQPSLNFAKESWTKRQLLSTIPLQIPPGSSHQITRSIHCVNELTIRKPRGSATENETRFWFLSKIGHNLLPGFQHNFGQIFSEEPWLAGLLLFEATAPTPYVQSPLFTIYIYIYIYNRVENLARHPIRNEL